MCDYSLQGLPNRLAVEGEQLVTYRFPTGSVGLAVPTDIAAANRPKPQGGCGHSWWSALKRWLDPQMELDKVPAVCIPPGAHLVMNDIPEVLRRNLKLHAVEVATFVQFSADSYRYRDGIRFRNGTRVLLQWIAEGVRFEVLSLGSSQHETETKPQRVPDPVPDCLINDEIFWLSTTSGLLQFDSHLEKSARYTMCGELPDNQGEVGTSGR